MGETGQQYGGGCLCGMVRYIIGGLPDWSAHCHCRSCQRATGAAFTTWVGVKTEHFQITAGQLAIYNSSPGVERGFCSQCGTSLTYVAETRWPGQVSILAPTLDNPQVAAPTAHFDVQDRLPWVKLNDGLPAHDNSDKERNMPTYSYVCSDYPGMEKCPGRFHAATEAELWKLIELHASIAHGENPAAWTENEKANLKTLIRTA